MIHPSDFSETILILLSWINLWFRHLDCLALQLNIWTRGLSLLIWLIWKSIPFWFSERKFLTGVHTVVLAHYFHLPNTTWRMFIASGTDWCTRWRVSVTACQLQKKKNEMTWKTLINLENNHFHSSV